MSPIVSRVTGRDERSRLVPPAVRPYFDDTFVRGCDLLEAYVDRLSARVFRATGLEAACASPASVEEAIVGAGLDPEAARVPARWLFKTLALRGDLDIVSNPGAVVR